MITARQISAIPDVKVFRAGIWKPRTRPKDFEGAGDKGCNGFRMLKRNRPVNLC